MFAALAWTSRWTVWSVDPELPGVCTGSDRGWFRGLDKLLSFVVCIDCCSISCSALWFGGSGLSLGSGWFNSVIVSDHFSFLLSCCSGAPSCWGLFAPSFPVLGIARLCLCSGGLWVFGAFTNPAFNCHWDCSLSSFVVWNDEFCATWYCCDSIGFFFLLGTSDILFVCCGYFSSICSYLGSIFPFME